MRTTWSPAPDCSTLICDQEVGHEAGKAMSFVIRTDTGCALLTLLGIIVFRVTALSVR